MPYGSGSIAADPKPAATCEYLVNGIVYSPTRNWQLVQDHMLETWFRNGSDVNSINPVKSMQKPRQSFKVWRTVPRVVLVRVRKTVYVDGKGFRIRYVKEPKRILVRRLVRLKPPKSAKSLPKAGWLRPNSLSFSKLKISTAGDTVMVGYKPSGTDLFTRRYSYPFLPLFPRLPNWTAASIGVWFHQPSSIPTVSTDDVEKEALARLLSRAKDGAANAAVNLAERAQTIEMCKNMFATAVRSLIALRAGKILKAVSLLFPHNTKELANQRLAYSFGLKPLINDISSIAKILAQDSSDEQTFDIVATASRSYKSLDSRSFNYGAKGRSILSTTSDVTCKYKMRVKIPSTATRNAALLGLTNTAELAWELIPFSFVLDWFLPVGNYLASLDSLLGLEIVWCTKTTVVKTKSQCIGSVSGADTDGFIWSPSSFSWTSENIQVTRTLVNTSTLKPPFPTFDTDPVSTGRVLNALALLRQRLK